MGVPLPLPAGWGFAKSAGWGDATPAKTGGPAWGNEVGKSAWNRSY